VYPPLRANSVDGSSSEVAAFVVFELAVATAAFAAFGRVRFARAISAAAFGMRLPAGVASIALMLTLKFDRLIEHATWRRNAGVGAICGCSNLRRRVQQRTASERP